MMPWKLSVVAITLAASAAFGAGLIAAPLPAPRPLVSANPVESMPVFSVTFTDAQLVQIAIESTGSRKLVSGEIGTLTASSCIPGKAVTSGTSTFAVDGEPLINLAMSTPMWRDFSAGDTGADVLALQAELTRLGYKTQMTGTFDDTTVAAYGRLATKLGASFEGDGIRHDRVLWLPLETQLIQKCMALPGARINAGQELADLPPHLVGARIASMPADSAPGERVLVIDGSDFNVDIDGQLTDEADLAELASLPSFAATQATETPGTLTGSYELTKATKVLAVPPSALFNVDGPKACISSKKVNYPVAIVGSQLGVSYVTGKATEEISVVDLTVGPKVRCG